VANDLDWSWTSGRDVPRVHHDRTLLNGSRQGGNSTIMALLSMHQALFEPRSLVLLIAPTQRQSAELLSSSYRMYRRLSRPVALLTESVLSLRMRNGGRIVAL
jgi:hypothetical protein